MVTGILPALVSGVLGFVFKHVTGVMIRGLGVVVLALAIGGINGGLLALNDATIRSSERAPAILTVIVVVLTTLAVRARAGDKLGTTVPERLSLKQLRDRALSTEVVELVGGPGAGHRRGPRRGERDGRIPAAAGRDPPRAHVFAAGERADPSGAVRTDVETESGEGTQRS